MLVQNITLSPSRKGQLFPAAACGGGDDPAAPAGDLRFSTPAAPRREEPRSNFSAGCGTAAAGVGSGDPAGAEFWFSEAVSCEESPRSSSDAGRLPWLPPSASSLNSAAISAFSSSDERSDDSYPFAARCPAALPLLELPLAGALRLAPPLLPLRGAGRLPLPLSGPASSNPRLYVGL